MNQSPTIGILAGMGPKSTSSFLDLVIKECEKQYSARHDIDFPKIIIACTDLTKLCSKITELSTIDSSQSLAEATIKKYLEIKRTTVMNKK